MTFVVVLSVQSYAYLPLVLHGLLPIIPDTTKVLPPSTTQYLTNISEDGTTFTFSQSTPDLQAISLGDIIVSDVTTAAPYGFLRKVSLVSDSGGQVILTTTGAVIEEAIQQGEASLMATLTPLDVISGTQIAGVILESSSVPMGEQGFYFTLEDVVLYDDDGNPDTTNDQITADGSIYLEPGFYFDIRVQDFHLEKLDFIVSANETVDLEINLEAEYPFLQKKIEVGRYYLTPFTVPKSPIPIVITPVLSLNVGIDGDVHVGITTGVTQDATMTGGLTYVSGVWSPVNKFTNQVLQYNPPTLSVGIDVKGFTSAQLSLLIYGIIGPYASLEPYLELEADIFANPDGVLYHLLHLYFC